MTEQDTPIATIVGLTPPNETAPSYSLHQVIPNGRFLFKSAAITKIEHRIENRGDHGNRLVRRLLRCASRGLRERERGRLRHL